MRVRVISAVFDGANADADNSQAKREEILVCVKHSESAF